VERPVRLVATLERMGYLRDGYTIGGSYFTLYASFEYFLDLYAPRRRWTPEARKRGEAT
jgi:hypothetical protein